MTELPGGAVDDVVKWLKTLLPNRPGSSTPITAWDAFGKLIKAMRVLILELAVKVQNHEQRLRALEGVDPDPDEPPYAPRTHNTTSRADARFCMDSKWGVRPTRVSSGAQGFVDEQGVEYDEAGRDLGGRSAHNVPELKGADSMDGAEPCDPYVGPTGVSIGGDAGYPAGSFIR